MLGERAELPLPAATQRTPLLGEGAEQPRAVASQRALRAAPEGDSPVVASAGVSLDP